MKFVVGIFFVAGIVFAFFYFAKGGGFEQVGLKNVSFVSTPAPTMHPLSIASLKLTKIPGSELVVIETLSPGSNYKRYRVSYESEGNTIYALLTVPNAVAPSGGYPVVVFNHGYIPPKEYRTTEKYLSYTDAFSKNGYVLIRPDYRGHGSSEGEAVGGYGSNAYTIDVLNALESVKKYPGVNPEKVGMWGHSMGGHITLRSMVVRKDIKAGVIWAGVVASYPELITSWRRRNTTPPPQMSAGARRWRDELISSFGEPNESSENWKLFSSTTYLTDISGPIQLHHGTADTSVPYEFSVNLDKKLKDIGKTSELFLYPGDDHNISENFGAAINKSVEFFDKYLKN